MEGLGSSALPSTSVSSDLALPSDEILPSDILLTSDLVPSHPTSSPLPVEETGTTSQFELGLQPVSSSTPPGPPLIHDVVSEPPVPSSLQPSSVTSIDVIETSEAVVTTSHTTSSLAWPPLISTPVTSSTTVIAPSPSSSSSINLDHPIVDLEVAPSSTSHTDDDDLHTSTATSDVNLVGDETISHVTVTRTSSLPPASSSRRPISISASTTSTSTNNVLTLSKSTSTAQAPMSAGSASASIGSTHADGSMEGLDTKTGQTNLSSFAIVGIVGGILVAFVIVYLIWYKWRRNKTKKASDDSPTDSTFQPHEKGQDANRNSVSSFGDDVDPFDDSRSEYTAYPSDRYHDRGQYDPRSEYNEWDGHTQLWDERGTRTQYLEHGDDADIEAELAGEQTSRPRASATSPNPFEVSPLPPVPPLPAADSPLYQDQPRSRSLTHQPAARPSTKASDPFGYDRSTRTSIPVSADAYDSLYEKYDHSRPASNYDRRATLQIPATAALVPWMRQHRQVEPEPVPVPPVPAVPSHQQIRKVKGDQRAAADQPRRAAPMAAMAKTPVGNGQGPGWSGVIPAFR